MKRIRISLWVLVPRRYRRTAYALLAVAAFVAGVYQAHDGDWKETVAYLGSALVGWMASANSAPDIVDLDGPRRR